MFWPCFLAFASSFAHFHRIWSGCCFFRLWLLAVWTPGPLWCHVGCSAVLGVRSLIVWVGVAVARKLSLKAFVAGGVGLEAAFVWCYCPVESRLRKSLCLDSFLCLLVSCCCVEYCCGLFDSKQPHEYNSQPLMTMKRHISKIIILIILATLKLDPQLIYTPSIQLGNLRQKTKHSILIIFKITHWIIAGFTLENNFS